MQASRARSRADPSSRPSSWWSLASLSDARWSVGITSRWVGACGFRSWKAIMPSARLTMVAGISPAAILQKTQPAIIPPSVSPGSARGFPRAHARGYGSRPGLWLSPERLPQLLPELPAHPAFRRWCGLDLRQPLEHRPLLRRELGGRPDVDAHMQVAAAAFAQPRQPLSLHPIHGARLRPRLHLERGIAVRRGNHHFGAQRRLGERDGQLGHGETDTNWPNIERAARRTSPVPLQAAQVVGRAPSCPPVPLHAVQRSKVRSRTVLTAPFATSSSVSSSVTFRSWPRWRSRRARSPPPKKASNPPSPPKSRMKMLSASERSKCAKSNPPAAPPRTPATP